MQINIGDLEEVYRLGMKLADIEAHNSDIAFGAGSQIVVDNTDGYRIGTLIFDGDFWTFNPERYGKTDD